MKAYIKPETLAVSFIESQALLTGSKDFGVDGSDTTETIATRHTNFDDGENWEDWEDWEEE